MKKVKKLTKEELRKEDFFLSHGHQVAEVMVKNQSIILTVLVTMFGVGVIWFGVTSWQKHQETVANASLYPVEKKIQDEMEKTKAVTDGSLAEYERVLKSESSTRGAMVSLITVTPNLLKVGKAATAAAWFKALTYYPKSDDFSFGLAKMTEALVALENHQPDEALALYQEILASPAQSSFQPEATLKMGVAYEAKKDLTKAREMFEKVHREHPSSRAGEMAFQYLLYLDQQKGA